MPSNFKYRVDDSLDDIFFEQSNTYFALRKIAWGDSENFKIDIRKYYSNATGEDTMSKGVSLTEEAADSLTESLVKNNFGNTKKLLRELSKRDDCDIEITDDNIDELVSSDDEKYYSAEELFGSVGMEDDAI